MLTKIIIHRFHSCQDLTLSDLGPTVVLVGRNGAGKTNILRAVQWAADVALQADPSRRILSRNAVTLEFFLDGTSYRYSAKVEKFTPQDYRDPRTDLALVESVSVENEDRKRKDIATRTGDNANVAGDIRFRLAPDLPFIPFIAGFVDRTHPEYGHIEKVNKFLNAIKYYPFDEPNSSREPQIIPKKTYEKWAAEMKSRSSGEDPTLFKLLFMHNEIPEEFDEIRAILGRDGLGLLDDIRVIRLSNRASDDAGGKNESEFYHVSFVTNFNRSPARRSGRRVRRPILGPRNHPTKPIRSFSFGALSLGTRRVIKMIVALVFDKSSVMLVEHPEDGIHRGLLHKVFGVLRSSSDRSQIIATSHSGLVLDDMRDNPGAIRLIFMENEKTRAQALTAEELEGVRRYIDEDGMFSDFLESHYDI